MKDLMPAASAIAASTYAAVYAGLCAFAGPWPAWLVAASLKGAALLAAAALLARKVRGAATRHLVWAFALALLLLLPALGAMLPALDLPAPALRAAPADGALPSPAGVVPAVSWSVLTAGAWGAGLLLVLASFGRSLGARRRLAAGARPVGDASWLALLDELCGRLRIRRRVLLRLSPEATVPMTWGLRQPVILLPADAGSWPAKRRRDVLLHELAHVRRGDAFTQAAARLACAVYWFHPLVWWAAHRLRAESEHACDDRVLAAGVRASDYAGHLLAAARSLRGAVPSGAVAMARPSGLESRIRAILEEGRDRSPVSARRLLATCLLTGCLALPLAATAPRTAPDAPPAPEAPLAPEAPEAPPASESPPAADAPPAPEAPPAPLAPVAEAPPAPLASVGEAPPAPEPPPTQPAPEAPPAPPAPTAPEVAPAPEAPPAPAAPVAQAPRAPESTR